MTISEISKQLIAYLADADDKKIKSRYSLPEESINEKMHRVLTNEQLRFLNEER